MLANSEAAILERLERLRRELHLAVGDTYSKQKVAAAKELSQKLDDLIVRYLKMSLDKAE